MQHSWLWGLSSPPNGGEERELHSAAVPSPAPAWRTLSLARVQLFVAAASTRVYTPYDFKRRPD